MAKTQPIKQRTSKKKVNETLGEPYADCKTLGEMIAKGYVLPTFEGKPRADGRPWSEIEGFEE